MDAWATAQQRAANLATFQRHQETWPERRRRVRFTDRQIQIAVESLERQATREQHIERRPA